ncbi:MAG: group 1 truncated hemoglobin [Vicinamibacteria bacterium]|nr:group 1 truncated hemoglobin [Vicinamibacteria bacterium]
MLAVTAWAQDPAAKPRSLYERLGGYDVIAKIVDDFGPKLSKDPAIAPLVAGLSMDHRMRNRQLVVDLLCEAAGGPCFYIGRTMLSSHQGLGITEDQFKQAGALMVETLDKFKIGEPERSELLGIIGKLRPDIVEKKKDPAPAGTAGAAKYWFA